jgi:hypothetical protein
MTSAKTAKGSPSPVECLVLGAPGTGKTTFALSLIEALGYREVQIFHEDPAGRVTSRTWPLCEAKERLVGRAGTAAAGVCTTRGLQWATVRLPGRVGRQAQDLTIVDSTGIGAEIADDPELRAAVAQTLRMLRRARMVIHLVSPADGGAPAPVDEVLRSFCADLPQGRYMPLAAKADLGAGSRAQPAWTRKDTSRGLSGAVAVDRAPQPAPLCARRRRDLLALVKRLRRLLPAAAHD